MLRRLRLLLMVCMAVALPVQGMASVTMMHCGPAHHGAPGPSHADHPVDHHAAGHESVSNEHHSTVASAASMPASGDADVEPATVAKTGAPSKVGCSACASCCLGAGMAAPQSSLPSFPGADAALAVAEEAAPAGITVDGLERPPRLNFA
jgi:hypothetical protein